MDERCSSGFWGTTSADIFGLNRNVVSDRLRGFLHEPNGLSSLLPPSYQRTGKKRKAWRRAFWANVLPCEAPNG